MTLTDITLPLAAASVFTLGGYGIARADRRHAEWIGHGLSIAFLLCALSAVFALTAYVAGPLSTE